MRNGYTQVYQRFLCRKMTNMYHFALAGKMWGVPYTQGQNRHITSQINALIANQFEQARAISMEGQRVIDGKGASRIMSELTMRAHIK